MFILVPLPSWEPVVSYKSLLLFFFSSGRLTSNISSGVGEYSLFHGGSVISKRSLGHPGFSLLGLRCVTSTGFFISRLSGSLASNIYSGVGEYSLFLRGWVVRKGLLGQARSCEFHWHCVSSNGGCTFFLLETRADNICFKDVTVEVMKFTDIKIPII